MPTIRASSLLSLVTNSWHHEKMEFRAHPSANESARGRDILDQDLRGPYYDEGMRSNDPPFGLETL